MDGFYYNVMTTFCGSDGNNGKVTSSHPGVLGLRVRMLFLLSFVVRGYGVGLGVNLLLSFHTLFKHNVMCRLCKALYSLH